MLRRNNIQNDKERKKKGQSTVEYVLLFAGVVVVVILFLKPGGPFSSKMNEVYGSVTGDMVGIANSLGSSHGNSLN